MGRPGINYSLPSPAAGEGRRRGAPGRNVGVLLPAGKRVFSSRTPRGDLGLPVTSGAAILEVGCSMKMLFPGVVATFTAILVLGTFSGAGDKKGEKPEYKIAEVMQKAHKGG